MSVRCSSDLEERRQRRTPFRFSFYFSRRVKHAPGPTKFRPLEFVWRDHLARGQKFLAGEISRIVCDAMFLENGLQFLPKTEFAMMLALIPNVADHRSRFEALTLRAPYPSCHENSVTPFIHFDELDFNRRTALAKGTLGGRWIKMCT